LENPKVIFEKKIYIWEVNLEDYYMSSKEIDRDAIFNKVKDNQLNLVKASKLLGLSYPHTKRLWSRYKKEGRRSLISKKRGQTSNRAVPPMKRKEILQIIEKHYQFCKPLFISEKLKERHNISFSSEFIRQLMIKHNLWIPNKKKQRLHQRRQRRECEGELEQIDASDHAWFEDRGPKCHLHLLVDDATSKIMGGHFAPEETTEGYYKACLPYFEKKGRPISLYSDKRGTFVVNSGPKDRETQFSRAMKELGIGMITAHSPQAKGRIERVFGTLQERLVWEMRLSNISTIEEANVFLPSFIEIYNKKYSEQPANTFNAHRPLNQGMELKYILCIKEERAVSKNLEVSYKNQIYQLRPPDEFKLNLKNSKITVITTLENEIHLEYKGHYINYVIYNELVKNQCLNMDVLLNSWKTKNIYIPPKDHPYKSLKVG
jgi:transposase